MLSLLAAAPVAEAVAHGPVNPWVALAYLVSGVFFILALRGLSSPATSRTGNRFGMIGMLIAVVTTPAACVPSAMRTTRRSVRPLYLMPAATVPSSTPPMGGSFA
mgnify:CR=1 FL=1